MVPCVCIGLDPFLPCAAEINNRLEGKRVRAVGLASRCVTRVGVARLRSAYEFSNNFLSVAGHWTLRVLGYELQQYLFIFS